MALKLFGFTFLKDKPVDNSRNIVGLPAEDGTISYVDSMSAYINMDFSGASDVDLINRYRIMADQAEIDIAIQEIVNEAIVLDEEQPISLNLDMLELPDEIKDEIRTEFENILNLLEFNTEAQNIFRKWYVDGRLHFFIVVDPKTPEEGIQELRYIDPRNIRKVRKETTAINDANIQYVEKYQEYFVYNQTGSISPGAKFEGAHLAPDSIAYIHSGRTDAKSGLICSYLHKAIKPLNMLNMMEDATVIYKISRAPERRIFYIDVGNLPRGQASKHLEEQAAKYRNKIAYDPSTGEIKDEKRHLSLMEDFWFARRDGKSTEVQQLQGGNSFNDMIEQLAWFSQKLYNSLNVPLSRLKADNPFGGIGRASEISREEYKFGKFIGSLRSKFVGLLLQILRVQLIMKGIITVEEWRDIKQKIRFRWAQDTYFSQLNDMEILRERITLLRDATEFVGKMFSMEYVAKNVMNFTDDQIKEEKAKMLLEAGGGVGEESSGPPDDTETSDDLPPSAEIPLPTTFGAGPNG